jgi:molecular chaperone Hsp33
VTPERRVSGAGGFLVQVLGGATEETLDALEATLASLRALSRDIEAGLTAEQLLERLTDGNFRILDRRPLTHHCPHDRDYYLGRLTSLGSDALDEAFEDSDTVEVICEFTRIAYDYTRAEIEAEQNQAAQN